MSIITAISPFGALGHYGAENNARAQSWMDWAKRIPSLNARLIILRRELSQDCFGFTGEALEALILQSFNEVSADFFRANREPKLEEIMTCVAEEARRLALENRSLGTFVQPRKKILQEHYNTPEILARLERYYPLLTVPLVKEHCRRLGLAVGKKYTSGELHPEVLLRNIIKTLIEKDIAQGRDYDHEIEEDCTAFRQRLKEAVTDWIKFRQKGRLFDA